MIRPTARAVWLLGAGIAVAALPAVAGPGLWPLWLGYAASCVLLLGLDALLAPRASDVEVRLEVPDEMFVGERREAVLHLAIAEGAGPIADVVALLDLDAELEPVDPAPVALAPLASPDAGARPGAGTRLGGAARFPLTPLRRGERRVEAAWIQLTGPLGLARRVLHRPLNRAVAVVPDVRGAREAALAFFGARQAHQGLKVERYTGDGSEFESLREFVPGFDARAIDWKATARHRRLLVREHRAERNHQVVLAFDTGHLMGEPLGGVPRLDHAIRAGLALAYVCLRTGDRVGLYAFDERVRRFVEPEGGVRAFPRIRAHTAGLAYGSSETNFTVAVAELTRRLRRRSLVVVFTEMVDTVTAELMIDSLGRAARRHVILFVALNDPSLDGTADAEPRSLDGLYQAVVAGTLVRERQVVMARLRRRAIHCVDAAPEAVSSHLLNRYLHIKRRELV